MERQPDLDWYVLDYAHHSGVQTLVKDLNELYTSHPALYHYDLISMVSNG